MCSTVNSDFASSTKTWLLEGFLYPPARQHVVDSKPFPDRNLSRHKHLPHTKPLMYLRLLNLLPLFSSSTQPTDTLPLPVTVRNSGPPECTPAVDTVFFLIYLILAYIAYEVCEESGWIVIIAAWLIIGGVGNLVCCEWDSS
jgi:hypothetical protein